MWLCSVSGKIENFRPEEILRLKSYIIPEPDLLNSACEMAALLEAKFLTEVERACEERVK